MKICMDGNDSVGLIFLTCLAEVGDEATFVDINGAKVESLNKGLIPIYKPDLREPIKYDVAKNRQSFITSSADEVKDSQLLFVAGGTQPNKDGSADMLLVVPAVCECGRLIAHYQIVLNKITLPMGAAELNSAANREELRKRNRINLEHMKVRYESFVQSDHSITTNSLNCLQCERHPANEMLAIQISIMNELSALTEHFLADIEKVRQGIAPNPCSGMAYDGRRFSKDRQDLLLTIKKSKFSIHFIKHNYSNLNGKQVDIWEFSFGKKTDKVYEDPGVNIVRNLVNSYGMCLSRHREREDDIRPNLGVLLHRTRHECRASLIDEHRIVV